MKKVVVRIAAITLFENGQEQIGNEHSLKEHKKSMI